VADALARLALSRPGPRLAAEVSFAELPARTEDAVIPTRHGDVPAVVYWPGRGDGPPPAYVNFHGGGFVTRHPEQDDPLCRYLAARAGVAVVNVDYDVAPAHRFPDPVEEAYDALAWVSAPGHGWDGSRLCAGGQSAGGALAAGAARLALELGGPAIALQVLHYAPLDLATAPRDKHVAGRPALRPWSAEVYDAAYVPSAAAKRDRLASRPGGPTPTGSRASRRPWSSPARPTCCGTRGPLMRPGWPPPGRCASTWTWPAPTTPTTSSAGTGPWSSGPTRRSPRT
jgi:acetyl esterase/lipase